MTITSRVQEITPERARNMLRKNRKNRRIRPRLVKELSAAIERGEWRFDGSPIRFDEEGYLLDGQHRLLAVVEAAQAVELLVVRGVPAQAQMVMDTGAKRSFADQLAIDGEAHALILASAAKVVWRWRNGYLGSKGYFAPKPTFAQLYTVLEDNDRLRLSVKAVANSLRRHVPMPPGPLAAARAILLEINEEDADHFFASLVDGTNLTKTDPVYRLREMLNENKRSRARYDSDSLLALMFKAWNAYRVGKPIKVLSYRPGGVAPEAFPVPC